MTNTDKLLLLTLESARPDQITEMLALSQKKGQPLAEWVVDLMRFQLASLTWEERQEVIAQFKEEDGIDLENL